MISVLVPVYNVEKYIKNSLDSIITQTYKNIEIILVDDGSTDLSGNICDEYSKLDNRIHVFHQKNQGVSSARNAALDRATGKYILFVDPDDVIDKNMLLILKKHIEKSDCDVAICGYEKNYNSGKKEDYRATRKVEIIDNFEAIRRINLGKKGSGGGASFCNKLFKAAALNNLRFKVGVTIGEDYGGLWDVLLNIKKVVLCPDILYYYIQRSDSVSYRGYSEASGLILKNYRRIRKEADKNYPDVCESTFGYCICQEMAIIISMVKADCYDIQLIYNIQQEIRKNLFRYFWISQVPIYLKACAALLSIHYKCLTVPYKVLFRKRMIA